MNLFTKSLKQRPLGCLLVIFVATLLVQGVAFTDSNDFLFIAKDVSKILVAPDRQFLYSQPLNFALAEMLGLDSVKGFIILHAAEIVLMLGLFAVSLKKKFADRDDRTLFIVLLSLTPLWLIILQWVGKPDPLVVGLLFLCWAYSGRLRILWVILMIMAHRELGTFLALFLYALEDHKDHNLLLAIFAGNGLQFVYEQGVLDHQPQNRFEDFFIKGPLFVPTFVTSLTLCLMSMFSWYWVVVLRQKFTKMEAAVVGTSFLLTIPAADFTRDFILLALPAVLFHIERMVRARENTWFIRLAPLALFHFQIAYGGHIYKPDNVLWDWLR